MLRTLMPLKRTFKAEVPLHQPTEINSIGKDALSQLVHANDLKPCCALNVNVPVQAKGVSIWAALRIPGVVSFALTLFFSKLVAYTFLYWLPFYLNSVDIGGRRLTPKVYWHLLTETRTPA